MSAKKIIVFASILLFILIATFGVQKAVATHNYIEVQKTDLANQKKRLEATQKELLKTNKLLEETKAKDQTNQEQIQKLETEKKELNDKLSVKLENEAKVAAAQQAAAKAAKVSLASTQTSYSSGTSTNLGNGWWCTDYVHSRRPDVPIYGNAGYNWIAAAAASGKATGVVPQAGAIAVMAGHVAYVESVNADGSYNISEMGWNYQPGNYNARTVGPGAFGGFIYT